MSQNVKLPKKGLEPQVELCEATLDGRKWEQSAVANGVVSGRMSDGRQRVSQGSVFEEQIGYSRAVADGRWVFVSGTTGFDYTTMEISDDMVDQVEQTLANIDSALVEAGACAADVVRVKYYLPDPDEFEACWPSLQRYFGQAKPAATMLVTGLADPRMKIEIEVTALKPDERL